MQAQGHRSSLPSSLLAEGFSMKVQMKVDVTGTRQDDKGTNLPWPARGETLDVSDEEARELIHAGIAVPVVDKKTEKATTPKSEQR